MSDDEITTVDLRLYKLVLERFDGYHTHRVELTLEQFASLFETRAPIGERGFATAPLFVKGPPSVLRDGVPK